MLRLFPLTTIKTVENACASLGGSRHLLAGALCVALVWTSDATAAQNSRDGFYAGLHVGVALPTKVSSARRYVSHPTRCDSLLYPAPLAPPADDPACRDSRPGVTSNKFDPEAGWAGGVMMGYAAGRLRVELEYLHASLGSARSPIGGTTSAALLSKGSEWSAEQPPFERISRYAVRPLFANVYYDFPGDSRWTPFFGFGFGWAAAELHYYLQFIRKAEAEYLQIEFDPDWPDVAKRAAAGTASILDTRASENVFGYQLLVGVDYALSRSLSVGALLRWARFDDIGHEAVYDVLRDHAGVLADGVTPFNNELTFSGIGYQALTVNLKYRF